MVALTQNRLSAHYAWFSHGGSQLDEIERHKKEKDKLFKILHQWIRWYPGDRRGSTNFATYSDLQVSLKIGLTEIVCKMHPYTTLCNFS